MNNSMNKLIKSQFVVLDGIRQNPLLSAFLSWRENHEDGAIYAQFLRVLFSENAQDGFLDYLSQILISDDNPFSRACATGNAPSSYLKNALRADFLTLKKHLDFSTHDDFARGTLSPVLEGLDDQTLARLEQYYRENGYGKFLKSVAFRFLNGELCPIQAPSSITLTDLKGFEREQEEVRDNFDNFVRGLPFSDMLLYGDRGTGKSSTVHAMVNEFSSKKLRLVELNKEELLALPSLKSKLATIPMKFVVFIDDFSLSESDERFSTLKASLQGSMEGGAENVMIVATSNRRHIVEENFNTRNNSVHAGDSEQELLSLSDRFGITVLFSTVSKREYLFIVRALAKDAKIKTEDDELESLAERWAIQKGGRSPRRAKQFINFLSACEQKGKRVEF